MSFFYRSNTISTFLYPLNRVFTQQALNTSTIVSSIGKQSPPYLMKISSYWKCNSISRMGTASQHYLIAFQWPLFSALVFASSRRRCLVLTSGGRGKQCGSCLHYPSVLRRSNMSRSLSLQWPLPGFRLALSRTTIRGWPEWHQNYSANFGANTQQTSGRFNLHVWPGFLRLLWDLSRPVKSRFSERAVSAMSRLKS